MTQILIKANNFINPDPEADKLAGKKGFPVVVMPDTHTWGIDEDPDTSNKFVIINVTDRTVEELRQYNIPWRRIIDWNIVNSNLTIDGYRLELMTTNDNLSGEGGITREMCENFLNNWNGSIVSTTYNSVIFDITVFNAICSQNFWGATINNILFTELDYNQTEFVHQIEANYFNTLYLPIKIQKKVKEKNATILSHNIENKTIVFEITRNDVLKDFKGSIKLALERTIYKRRFRINETFVDDIIENHNGRISVTFNQLQPYIIDKMNE